MRRIVTVLISLLLASHAAFAAPPVYRCETDGRVAYSDAPCVGARVIDATPTQGVDRMSGQSRKGAEVQRTELNNALDDALRPLTGKSREEMDVLRRRSRLSPQDRAECARLDRQAAMLEGGEGGEGASDNRAHAEAQVRLYQVRKRSFDLKC